MKKEEYAAWAGIYHGLFARESESLWRASRDLSSTHFQILPHFIRTTIP